MDHYELRKVVSRKLKLIRVESGFNQSQMASILGMSKKTLVQIEKERIMANWTTTVAVCALFPRTDTLHSALEGRPEEIIIEIAHSKVKDLPLLPCQVNKKNPS
ncbi:hypothetical protein LF817_15290 [Halobacillus sp. A1]|uniref:helix-turn-helix transcriptional regulator n=1 Tax=Halobacillus sp. A1 TaxID=2880262 RepID=UPI0020A646C8|nr:hypothetical protein [Halobacillus sp. A1]MCP3032687.1 hypothetical protein [Halobacillus sp. A1]